MLWKVMLPLFRVSGRPLSSSLPAAAAAVEGEPAPKPFSEMPGMKGWPFFGIIPMRMRELKKRKGGDETMFYKLQSKFGPIFKLKMLGKNWEVVTSSPEAAEIMYNSEGKYPSRGSLEDNTKWLFDKLKLPVPMFFARGEAWKRTRTNASRQVVPRRVANFVEPLGIIAEDLMSHLDNIKDKDGNIQDITPELMKWTFQGVSYFVYGEKINIYSDDVDPLHKEYMEAGVAYIGGIQSLSVALPTYKIYPNKLFRHYKRTVRKIHRVGRQILDRSYHEIKDAIATGTVDETKAVGVLKQWLIEGNFTEEQALLQSYDLLSAGIDTTSSSAAFLLYEIAKHPEIQERLMQEITSIVGDKEHPTWDDLQKMTLVRNCVKETMRIHIPTGGPAPRVMPKDVVLCGYHVPAGTTVRVNLLNVAKDEKVFQDPMEFKPDRWSRDSAEKSHPMASIPFGFGSRACYGRRLGELELYLLLTKIIPKYRLTTNIKNMKIQKMLVIKPAIPLHINLTRRI